MDDRYPIGRFTYAGSCTPAERSRHIEAIAELPARLRDAVRGLSREQLDTPYREGGWTVRQVVHHVADSHMNSYVRFRLALTEDEPVIKPYDEALWAGLPDARTAPVESSLALLAAMHERWVALLRSMSEDQFGRKFRHPQMGEVTLDRNTALYAWHGAHHVAHVTSLRQRRRWE